MSLRDSSLSERGRVFIAAQIPKLLGMGEGRGGEGSRQDLSKYLKAEHMYIPYG